MPKGTNNKIKVGSRVLLKKDKRADGKVVSTAGKAEWKVHWGEGEFKGNTTEQSALPLYLWKIGLSNQPPESESSEESEVKVEPKDHADLKTRFDTLAQGLVGKKTRYTHG